MFNLFENFIYHIFLSYLSVCQQLLSDTTFFHSELPNFAFSLKKKNMKGNLCCPQLLGYVTFHRNMSHLLGATLLENVSPPLAVVEHLAVAPLLGWELRAFLSFLCWYLVWLDITQVLCMLSQLRWHHVYDFMCMISLLCL